MKLDLKFERFLPRPPTSVYLTEEHIYISEKGRRVAIIDYSNTDLRTITSPDTVLTIIGNVDATVNSDNPIYCTESKSIYVESKEGMRKITDERGPFNTGCYDPTRKVFYIGHSCKKVLIMDADYLPMTGLYGPETEITDIALSTRGLLAVIARLDSSVRIFEGDKATSFPLGAQPRAIKFITHNRIAVGTDTGVSVMGTKTGKVLSTYEVGSVCSLDVIGNVVLAGTTSGKIILLRYENKHLEQVDAIETGGMVVYIRHRGGRVVVLVGREPRLDRFAVDKQARNKLMCFTISADSTI